MLIPIQIDQLQTLAAATEQESLMVLTSTIGSAEYKLYNQKVRALLKFILKSQRITYIHLSSFSKLNDTKQFYNLKNYIFLKYPINSRALAVRIVNHYHHQKTHADKSWPGGKRAGVKGISV